MRRTIDVLVSGILLVVLSPLMLALCLAIAILSPGNPFYGGPRVGRHGRPFRMWKFRTMVPNASNLGPPITVKDDPRVTPLGRFLRNSKLDEIPQLINVFLGEMTLVGPRPETPEMVALYNAWEQAVLSVKPGVTGVVQLSHPDESDSIPLEGGSEHYVGRLMHKKLSIDMAYLSRRTPLTDVRVVFATVTLVINRVIRL